MSAHGWSTRELGLHPQFTDRRILLFAKIGIGIEPALAKFDRTTAPPPGCLESLCVFLSRLSLGKIAELSDRDVIPKRSVLHPTSCPGPLRASRAIATTHVARKECLQCVTTV